MCDRYRHNLSCPVAWNRRFYEEYLHHHAAMTQWVQQLNYYALSSGHSSYQNIPFNAPQRNFNFYASPNGPRSVTHHYPYHHRHHGNNHFNEVHSYPSRRNHISSTHHQDYHNFSSNNVEINTAHDSSSEGGIVETDRDDIIGSDDEICFNFDSIAALRHEKDTSSEKIDTASEHTSDDFELLDTVPNVEFEYVHLDKFGKLEKGEIGVPDTANEIEKEKEKKIFLYGERADTLGGLETAVTLDFTRHCDLFQPTLWPVLPLQL